MNQNQLITINDIQAIRSLKYDDVDSIDKIIMEAQEMDIKPFLGIELYYQVVTDQATYDTLLNGGDYTYGTNTINWVGLKKMLAYYALARIYSQKNYTDTDTGLVRKTNEFSEQVSETTIARLSGELRSIAEHYQSECIMFLGEHSTETKYENWNGSQRNTGGSFKIRSAGRYGSSAVTTKSYRPDDQYRNK